MYRYTCLVCVDILTWQSKSELLLSTRKLVTLIKSLNNLSPELLFFHCELHQRSFL